MKRTVKGDPEYIHKLNREIVVNCVYFGQPISRIEISRRTHISKSTVTNIVKELLADETLVVHGLADSYEMGGRCPELLLINREAKYFVGVNIGRCVITVVISDIYGEVIDNLECPMIENPGFEEVISLINELISSVIKKNEERVSEKVMGIGVSVSGIVNSNEGIVIHSPNLSWQNADVRSAIEKVQKIPVFVDNCTRCMARSYVMFNKKERFQSFLCVNIAYGIGSAIVRDFDIGNNSRSYASELGHITVDEHGPMCSCGKKGCLENYASGRAIARRAKERIRNGEETLIHQLVFGDITKVDAKVVAEAAEQGDLVACEILEDAAGKLGLAISHAVNLLELDAVILEGGVSRTKAGFIEKIREVAMKNIMSNLEKKCRIELGTLGKYTETLGAVGLVINSLAGISYGEEP